MSDLDQAIARAISRVSPRPVYGPDGVNPLLDVVRAKLDGDDEARERIRVHNEQAIAENPIMRASARSLFGGLLVPQYLAESFAGVARVGRPFLDTLVSDRLEASSVIIPRGVVGTQAGAHIENAAYGSANASTTDLSLTARTVAAFTEVSIESAELGSLVTPVMFRDLIGAYDSESDRLAFYGLGDASSQIEGILSVATTGTPIDGSSVVSFASTRQAVLAASAQSWAATKIRTTHVAMSSARWTSLQSATDSEGRPLIAEGARTFVDHVVVVDDNVIGEDDDAIVVYRADQLVLLEQNGGSPTTIRVDEKLAAQGTVQFIARGYAAFSAERRPDSTVVVESLPEPAFPLPATDDQAES